MFPQPWLFLLSKHAQYVLKQQYELVGLDLLLIIWWAPALFCVYTASLRIDEEHNILPLGH